MLRGISPLTLPPLSLSSPAIYCCFCYFSSRFPHLHIPNMNTRQPGGRERTTEQTKQKKRKTHIRSSDVRGKRLGLYVPCSFRVERPSNDDGVMKNGGSRGEAARKKQKKRKGRDLLVTYANRLDSQTSWPLLSPPLFFDGRGRKGLNPSLQAVFCRRSFLSYTEKPSNSPLSPWGQRGKEKRGEERELEGAIVYYWSNKVETAIQGGGRFQSVRWSFRLPLPLVLPPLSAQFSRRFSSPSACVSLSFFFSVKDFDSDTERGAAPRGHITKEK